MMRTGVNGKPVDGRRRGQGEFVRTLYVRVIFVRAWCFASHVESSSAVSWTGHDGCFLFPQIPPHKLRFHFR